jgi:hypothetical protein
VLEIESHSVQAEDFTEQLLAEVGTLVRWKAGEHDYDRISMIRRFLPYSPAIASGKGPYPHA